MVRAVQDTSFLKLLTRTARTNTLIVLCVLHQTWTNLKVFSYWVVDTLMDMVNMSRARTTVQRVLCASPCITLFTPIPRDETQTPGQCDPFTPHPSPLYHPMLPCWTMVEQTNRSKFVDLSFAHLLCSCLCLLFPYFISLPRLIVSLFQFSGWEFLLNLEINIFLNKTASMEKLYQTLSIM